MRFPYAAAAALTLLAGGAALAEPLNSPLNRDIITRNPPMAQPGTPDETDLKVGMGVICNTSVQAESYVNLRARGTETMRAVNSINEEAKDPKACGLAAIAYRRDRTMTTKSLNGNIVDIVRINVLAGYDGRDWARIPDMTQYAIIEVEGVAI